MLNVYTGTLVLALHLLPAVLLWATWRLPQAAAGSKIVLGQVLGSVGFLLLFPLVEQLSWGAGPWALYLDLTYFYGGGLSWVYILYLITAGAVALGAVRLQAKWKEV